MVVRLCSRQVFRRARVGFLRALAGAAAAYLVGAFSIAQADPARALAELVHERWQRATGEHVPVMPAQDAPWPDVAPDFTDVEAAIAHGRPAMTAAE